PRPDPHGYSAPRHERDRGAQGTSCGSHDAGDSGHRRHSVGHGPGPPEDHGGGLRRLPGQADQRAGAPSDGAWALGEILMPMCTARAGVTQRTPIRGCTTSAWIRRKRTATSRRIIEAWRRDYSNDTGSPTRSVLPTSVKATRVLMPRW